MDNIKYAIEGILFAAGEPVKAAKLAVVLDRKVQEIEDAVAELKEEYDNDHRGFNIIEISDGYQICSRPEYYTYIREILGEQRNQPLSNAAMEALAIIAYKQPVTRGMVEKIRGVNSDGCVNRLYERGLIDECGRLDAPGRPILYKTTDVFLRCFGLRTPRDLPPINFKNIMPELAETGEQLSITEDEEVGEVGETPQLSEQTDQEQQPEQ
ncbi:MAG: SMC-Scp complex subunit ScpB [Clostridiales bacterium]|nr:SMC-Scp complex subunit ScpB [Clostridiales bacterium]